MTVDEPDETDVRQVRPQWAKLAGLVDGARRRGWAPEQIAYLESCLGVAWATATHAAETAMRKGKPND